MKTYERIPITSNGHSAARSPLVTAIYLALIAQTFIAFLFGAAWLDWRLGVVPQLNAATEEWKADAEARDVMRRSREDEIRQQAEILLQLEQERRVIEAIRKGANP